MAVTHQTHLMMTSLNGNIFRVTGPLWGESPVDSPHKGQWGGALIFFFDLHLNKRLNKQSGRLWFEASSECVKDQLYGILSSK